MVITSRDWLMPSLPLKVMTAYIKTCSSHPEGKMSQHILFKGVRGLLDNHFEVCGYEILVSSVDCLCTR